MNRPEALLGITPRMKPSRALDWPLHQYLDEQRRLHGYVERTYTRSGAERWPTVAECARARNLRYLEVMELVEDCEDMTLSWWRAPLPGSPGELFVESYGPPGGSENGQH